MKSGPTDSGDSVTDHNEFEQSEVLLSVTVKYEDLVTEVEVDVDTETSVVLATGAPPNAFVVMEENIDKIMQKIGLHGKLKRLSGVTSVFKHLFCARRWSASYESRLLLQYCTVKHHRSAVQTLLTFYLNALYGPPLTSLVGHLWWRLTTGPTVE